MRRPRMPRGWRNSGRLKVTSCKVWGNGDLITLNLQPGTLPASAHRYRVAPAGRRRKGGQEGTLSLGCAVKGRVTDYETGKQGSQSWRANTYESGIGGTSPVAMYPLGESKPFGLWDLAGNVWEWTNSWYDKGQRGPCGAGGSWTPSGGRPSVRSFRPSGDSLKFIGFRLVSPISSVS